MTGTLQLIMWFIVPAPIIFLWVFVTNSDAKITEKFQHLLLGELFGPVSALFIIAFWIDMLLDKIKSKK